MLTLKRQLKKWKRDTAPRREFRSQLMSQLGDEFSKTYPASAKALSFSFKFATASVIALVLLVGTGTGVYAYDSPQVADGHALFPMKQGIERVEGWFARHPEGKAKFHLKMMGRRLDEAEMHEQKEAMLEYAAEELGMSVEELKSEMFDPNKRNELVEQLITQNERFVEIFAQMPPLEPMHQGIKEHLRYYYEQVEEGQFSEDQRECLHQQFRSIMKNNKPMNWLNREPSRLRSLIN